jgi:glycosyltransferase involved in cell wall biosynthesis
MTTTADTCITGRARTLRRVVLSAAAQLGGAERSLLTFLRHGADNGVEATVLLPRNGPLARELSELDVPWSVVRQPGALLCQSRRATAAGAALLVPAVAQTPGYLARLAAAVRRARPDVVYTNGIKCHLLAAALRPLLGVRTVWHLRDFWRAKAAGRLADHAADLVIANSRATALAIQRNMRRPDRVAAIHNAVDVHRFRPTGPRAEPPAGRQDDGRPRIALAAAFARWKGHHLLLRAAPRVLAEFPQARLFLIGGPIYDTVAERGYASELHRAVRERGLARNVVFTGFQADMAPWYRAVDVVVNASVRPEPFGRTLLEAMACGRAVVGPNAGGVPEFVRPGHTGLLYEMEDAEGLAHALAVVLRSRSLRERLGAAGRRAVLSRFRAEQHAQAVAAALRRAAAGASRHYETVGLGSW